MRRLLVINPNTSESVSALLQRHVQAAAGQWVAVQTVTAAFGAPYIADEASYAVAAHATLDAWAHALANRYPAAEPPDAVLIGCFGDPGLLALRSASAAPITGLAEAAFSLASAHGRFVVVTGGVKWVPMLARLAQTLGFAEQLAGIEAVTPSGIELAADPLGAQRLLTDACAQLVARTQAQAVIIGGAGLAGLAAKIAPALSVPVIDSVQAGTAWALRQPSQPGRAQSGFDVAWHNLPQALTALGIRQTP